MDVKVPPEIEAVVAAEAAQLGITPVQWWNAAAQAAAEKAARITEGLAEVDAMLAEVGGPDPAIEAQVAEEFARSEARRDQVLAEQRSEPAA